jgi:predicted O-linked N-acetylglucosamine transferase (SPINDLY family)
LSAIDCLLADRFHVRDGEDQWYSETVLRLPHDYICYGPPTDAPQLSPLPASRSDHVTFGCFNFPGKYSKRLLDAWAEILSRVPRSQLLLKAAGLDEPLMQRRLHRWFQDRRVAPERVSLEGWCEPTQLLAAYNRVDLALDTQPYSGGLTTCEALWMGVPVVTCPGPTFAGRHSTSHMTNGGYGQFVAQDFPGYVELAAQWAGQLDELAAIRRDMRESVRRSPLCDAPQFARALIAVLNEAWQRVAKGTLRASAD